MDLDSAPQEDLDKLDRQIAGILSEKIKKTKPTTFTMPLEIKHDIRHRMRFVAIVCVFRPSIGVLFCSLCI